MKYCVRLILVQLMLLCSPIFAAAQTLQEGGAPLLIARYRHGSVYTDTPGDEEERKRKRSHDAVSAATEGGVFGATARPWNEETTGITEENDETVTSEKSIDPAAKMMPTTRASNKAGKSGKKSTSTSKSSKKSAKAGKAVVKLGNNSMTREPSGDSTTTSKSARWSKSAKSEVAGYRSAAPATPRPRTARPSRPPTRRPTFYPTREPRTVNRRTKEPATAIEQYEIVADGEGDQNETARDVVVRNEAAKPTNSCMRERPMMSLAVGVLLTEALLILTHLAW